MVDVHAFTAAFSTLNPHQRQAVEHIDGPVMVIAGPGTGKTQVLTLRIANILAQTDTNPANILALTYTEAAAKNMKERLVQLVGPTAYQVVIGTFHSFAERLLQDFPEFFPLQRWSRIAAEYEKLRIVRQLLDQPHWTTLRTPGSPYHYATDILTTISELKRENVTPQRYQELLDSEVEVFVTEKNELRPTKLAERERKISKMSELAEMYQQYQRKLHDQQLYDFDDLILMAVQGLQSEPVLAATLQEKYQYLLIDEFQDTNSAQFELALQLSQFWGPEANIFVVGDPHQTIFRFQGATFTNIELFLQHFPTALIVQLQTGYRSPAAVYAAAHQIIAAGESHQQLPAQLTAFNQPLTATNQTSSPVEVWRSANQRCEAVGIATRIQQLIHSGVPPAEIAILYKKHAQADAVIAELTTLNLPFATMKATNLWESSFLNQLITALQLIQELPTLPTDDVILAVLLHPWLALDRLTLLQLSQQAYAEKRPLLELIHQMPPTFDDQTHSSPYSLSPETQTSNQHSRVSQSELEKIKKTMELLSSLASDHVGQPLSLWLDTVIRERLHILAWILSQPARFDLTQQLRAFLQAVKEWNQQSPNLTLSGLLEIITTHREEGISLTGESLEPPQAAVTLSTIHSAKGREWSHVFVLQVVDGVWGNERSRAKLPLPSGILRTAFIDPTHDSNADDRRLFYVALTRAKQHVVLSLPQTLQQNLRASDKLPSQFIVELQNAPQATDFLTQTHFEIEAVTTAQPESKPTTFGQGVWSEAEKKWISQLLHSFRLSATSLDTYLRSPSEFFWYNLAKLPKIKNDTMVFGTAIHTALEAYYRTFLSQKIWLPSDEVIRIFERALNRELLSESDRQRRLQQGHRVLHAYLSQPPTTTTIETEYTVGYGPSQVVIHGLALSGKIDRIDTTTTPHEVVVVDYKTGTPKTKGEILGQTLSAEQFMSEREQLLPAPLKGRYHRQLLFYKLLLDQDRRHSWQVVKGRLEFVEPTKTGKISPQEFALSTEDVEQLKALISQVADELLSLQFLDQVKQHPDEG